MSGDTPNVLVKCIGVWVRELYTFLQSFTASGPQFKNKGWGMARTNQRRLVRLLGMFALALAAIAPLPRVVTSQDRAGTPTFSKDVAPIFQEKCQACHRRDSIAPMSLVTYEETKPWAKGIKERVITRNMPPWHLDKTVGIQHFANDRSLTDQEIDTIVRLLHEAAGGAGLFRNRGNGVEKGSLAGIQVGMPGHRGRRGSSGLVRSLLRAFERNISPILRTSLAPGR